MLKLGSINNFMSMIPGMGKNMLNANSEEDSIKKIKKFIVIMDSMTQ